MTYEKICTWCTARYIGGIISSITSAWALTSNRLCMDTLTSLALAIAASSGASWISEYSGDTQRLVASLGSGCAAGIVFVCTLTFVSATLSPGRSTISLHVLFVSLSIGRLVSPHLQSAVHTAVFADNRHWLLLHPATSGEQSRNYSTLEMVTAINTTDASEIGESSSFKALLLLCCVIYASLCLCFIALLISDRISRNHWTRESAFNHCQCTNHVEAVSWKFTHFSADNSDYNTTLDGVKTVDLLPDEEHTSLPYPIVKCENSNTKTSIIHNVQSPQFHSLQCDLLSDRQTSKTQGDHDTDTDRHKWFKAGVVFDATLLMYLYVFFALPISMESLFSVYTITFVLSGQYVHIDHKLLSIVYWTGVISGRVLFAILSRYTAPNPLMISAFTINVAAVFLLIMYSAQYPLITLTATSLLGLFLGPILPAGFTWANVYLRLCAKTTALVYCIMQLGCVVCVGLCGLLMDYFGAVSMFYMLVTCAVTSMVLYIPVMPKLGKKKLFKVKVVRRNDYVYSNSSKVYI